MYPSAINNEATLLLPPLHLSLQQDTKLGREAIDVFVRDVPAPVSKFENECQPDHTAFITITVATHEGGNRG